MKKIGVMGTGTMGSGIIQVCAASGYDVVIRSSKQEYIDGALAKIEKNLTKMVSREKITEEDKAATLGRISGGTTFDILADCDLIIESSTENMDKKKELFAELDKVCKDDAILATNTSALSITEIAAVTSRPAQVIGMHFFNPVPAMKLVEVVKGIATSDEVKDAVIAATESLKKTPVEVAEAPGFVVNRVLIPMINEAIGILADGVASAEGIDTAMKLGANHPMGPLELGDFVGLDICLAIMDVLYNEPGDSKYRACPLLRKMVRGGNLGVKSGKGFYVYNADRTKTAVDAM